MSALISLLTAGLVLTAFRLPALMMFRGIRPPLGLRRPVMVVRAPMPRSMPVVNPNLTSVARPPLLNPLQRQLQLWPFPGPLVPPMQYSPPKLPVQEHPLPPPPPPPSAPQPSETHLKPMLAPVPHPNPIFRPSNSMNNRPFFKLTHNHDYLSSTSPKPLHFEKIQQIFRPSNQTNRFKKISKEYNRKKTTTESHNNHNSGNEEVRYAMMYPMPMPRNYQNDEVIAPIANTTSTIKPQTSLGTTTSTPPITTTTQKRQTKVWVKPSLKSNDNKNSSIDNSLEVNEKPTPTTNYHLKSTRKRFRSNKIRTKMTTTTELWTDMTPAPIENYKPVKASVGINRNDISQQLMFDDSKNLYYFVTLRPI